MCHEYLLHGTSWLSPEQLDLCHHVLHAKIPSDSSDTVLAAISRRRLILALHQISGPERKRKRLDDDRRRDIERQICEHFFPSRDSLGLSDRLSEEEWLVTVFERVSKVCERSVILLAPRSSTRKLTRLA